MRKLLLLALLSLLSCTSYAQSDIHNTAPKWDYKISTDRMSDEKTQQCTIYAAQDFGLPSGQPSLPTFAVRIEGNSLYVILQVPNVEFCDPTDHFVNIRFDHDQPESYEYYFPVEGKKNTIILKEATKLLAKLRKGKKMLVQARFILLGERFIDFHTADFPIPEE